VLKRLRSAFAVLLSLVFASTAAAAEVRPEVAVSFVLAVERWQDHFGSGRPAFESQAAERISKWFGERVGFALFTPSSTSPNKLAVHLEPTPDTANRTYKETRLRLVLTGGPNPAAPLIWPFRSAETYAEPISGGPGLLKELEFRLEQINPALINQVLSQVSIAKKAHLWKNPVGWVIPYRMSELCMGASSVVRIVSMMPTDVGLQQRSTRGIHLHRCRQSSGSDACSRKWSDLFSLMKPRLRPRSSVQ
jgi:hypothetical protein